MFAPSSVPRQMSQPSGVCGLTSSLVCCLGLAALAAGWTAPAAAEPQSRKSEKVLPADPGKPAFFVDWTVANPPPGLTARPARAKNDNLPIFPPESARRHESGTTSLSACVTAEGRLVDVKVARSSGFARLDEATIDWARTAKFTPALINGDPVNICGYSVEYTWKLDG